MNFPALETVLFEKNEKQGVISIILNRPDKKNALNDQLVDELKKAFVFAKSIESVRIVILKGSGDSFCSGADLAYLKSLHENNFKDNVTDSKLLSELYLMIAEFPKPVIAQIAGFALAGGCGLASVCDFIIAEENARFGYPEVKIGFIAAMVSLFLIKQVGERKARELLLTGKIISATEAENIGLINRAVPNKEINKTMSSLVNELLNNSPKALEVTKGLFNSFQYLENDTQVNKLAKINASFRQTDDFFEGLTAFLEKRKPSWQAK